MLHSLHFDHDRELYIWATVLSPDAVVNCPVYLCETNVEMTDLNLSLPKLQYFNSNISLMPSYQPPSNCRQQHLNTEIDGKEETKDYIGSLAVGLGNYQGGLQWLFIWT